MSRMASITFKFCGPLHGYTWLLSRFLDASWTLGSHGVISYVPVGGDFGDWVEDPPSQGDRVMSIVDEKEKRAENAAVILSLPENETKGAVQILLMPDRLGFHLVLDAERKRIGDKRATTDFSFYLSMILTGVMQQNGFPEIQLLECSEIQ